MKPLGSGSIAVYDVIERHYSLCGQSPSINQIMVETDFKSRSGVRYHLAQLEQAEWITRDPHQLHGITPIRQPRIFYRPAAPGWVCAAPDYTKRCPDCVASIAHAQRNGDGN